MDWKADVIYLNSRYILKINLTITLHNKTKKGTIFLKVLQNTWYIHYDIIYVHGYKVCVC